MKWYHYVLIGIFVVLLVVIGWQCMKDSDKDARIAELQDSLQTKEGLTRVDSNTYIKKGQEMSKNELQEMALRNGDFENQVEYLKQRNKELTGIIKIKTVFSVDTIFGPADTVYKNLFTGVETGEKVFKDEYFSAGFGWSCNPYQATLYHLRVWDELSILPFKDSDGEGVMVSNKNPYVEIGSVLYYFEKVDRNPDRFYATIGLGSNNAADLSGKLSIGYGDWGLSGTLNFNKGVVKDRKIISDDWRLYLDYRIVK